MAAGFRLSAPMARTVGGTTSSTLRRRAVRQTRAIPSAPAQVRGRHVWVHLLKVSPQPSGSLARSSPCPPRTPAQTDTNRSDVRDTKPDQNGPVIIRFLIVELPTPVFELDNGSAAHPPVRHLLTDCHTSGIATPPPGQCDERVVCRSLENARPALIFVLLLILAGHPIERGSSHRSIQQNVATSSTGLPKWCHPRLDGPATEIFCVSDSGTVRTRLVPHVQRRHHIS